MTVSTLENPLVGTDGAERSEPAIRRPDRKWLSWSDARSIARRIARRIDRPKQL